MPIAKPKKKGAKQLRFDTEWTQDRIEENKLVNDIRRRVAMWRKGGYVGVTPTTARLIAYWTDPNREKKLFFCQNEALETAIYIAEIRAPKKLGMSMTRWVDDLTGSVHERFSLRHLRSSRQLLRPRMGLNRIAKRAPTEASAPPKAQ